MVEICEECNQCVPDNGICLGCGLRRGFVYGEKQQHINHKDETDQYEGNE